MSVRCGFSFENCRRNEKLCSDKSVSNVLPKAKKTGTTIVGVIFNGGVVIGADTRATMGSIVADKNCLKIHYLTDNIYCCGAGTAGDTLKVTDMVSKTLNLMALNTGRKVRVITAVTILKQYLFRYQGHVGAHLIVGGVDYSGPHLYSLSNHGHSDHLPYTTMGSGSLAAIAYFETSYKHGLSLEEAKLFVRNGIFAGVFNDLGSGSNVDLCIITNRGLDLLRNYEIFSSRSPSLRDYTFNPGTTMVMKQRVSNIPYSIISREEERTGPAIQ